ncbi:MAG: small basic protein [Planctomycetota bacterium]|jgi:small basic protein (TIGR04137 family)|nr:small basic protein [Planctomycetota bacterium]
MSVHKSLFIGGALKSVRSVWSRRERLERLMRDGKWEEGDSVYGIPKVRTQFKVANKKKKKTEEVAADSAEVTTDESAESAEE